MNSRGTPEAAARGQVTPETAKELEDWGYYEPVERHRRFEIEEHLRRQGFDYFWAALKIGGQQNPRLPEYWRAAWRPAKAKDFPHIAGLDLNIDRRMQELGFIHVPKEDDPIVDGDLMLVMRPMQFSTTSRRRDAEEAHKALFERTEALRQRSQHAIGNRTQISHTYTRGVPPDQVPDVGPSS